MGWDCEERVTYGRGAHTISCNGWVTSVLKRPGLPDRKLCTHHARAIEQTLPRLVPADQVSRVDPVKP